MIFDPANPADPVAIRAVERLATDRVAWLTTVTPDGQPQTMPIWFLWEGAEIVVYGDHRARRNRNIDANPRVSFHLADNGVGDDVVVIEGTARFDPDYPPVPDNPAYLARYGDWIDAQLGGPYQMAQTYSMVIRITPTRGIAFGV